MECAVYDTYVQKSDGKTMHFDVVVEADTSHEKAVGVWQAVSRKRWSGGAKNDSRRMSILSYPGSTPTN